MGKIKLLIMTDDPNGFTGLGRVGREIALGLHGTGKYDINYLAWFHPEERINKMPFEIHTTEDKTNRYLYGDDIFDKVVDKAKPDIVLSIGDPWMVGYIPKTRNRNNFKWMHYLTIDGAPLYPPFIDLISNIDCVVHYCKFSKDVVEKAIPTLNAPYIYHGVDSFVFREMENRDAWKKENGFENDFVLGCVARNSTRKNLIELLDVFAEWSEDKDNAKLFLHTNLHDTAGFDLEEHIKNLDISEKVPFTRGISWDKGIDDYELSKVYNLFDWFVMLSKNEGFGLPILEAFSCGVPLIGIDYASIGELGEGHGVLLKQNEYHYASRFNVKQAYFNHKELMTTLDIVYKDKSLRDLYSGEAKRFAIENQWEDIIRKWDELIEDFHSNRKFDRFLERILKNENNIRGESVSPA